MHIEPGVQARDVRVVAESDTARALGTGLVAVLATSRLLAWGEAASLQLLSPHVAAGSTSVAMRVQMDHIRAASIGCVVTTVATLERIEGRRYSFAVVALDENDEELARGSVIRVVVELDTFLAKACGSAK